MPTIQINVGDGMTFNGNKLTTKWDPDDDTQPTKTEEGLIIPDLVGQNRKKATSLNGKADGVTVREDLDGNVSINNEVVAYIHTMNAFKVTNRTSSKDFAVDTSQVKTIDDIRDEMNALMDADSYLNGSMYMSIREKNFFQLIHAAHPVQDKSWPCAIDSNTRLFGDTTLAFFVVTEVEHNAGRDTYVTKLSLRCLWSNLSGYVKGTEYTSVVSP